MKNVQHANFIGIWKSKNMPPSWIFSDYLEISIYSYERFSISVNGELSLLVEGELSVKSIENDVFEFQVDGVAIRNEYLNLSGRMYIPYSTPSFVLTIPGYGERYFERTRK